MNVLLSGTNGFVGKNLVDELLKQKHFVVGVGRKNSKQLLGSFHVVDLLSQSSIKVKSIEKCQVAIHTAAKIKGCSGSENLKMLQNFFEIARLNRVSHFIFISSTSVIDGTNNLYSRDKRECEKWALEHIAKEMKLTILRPSLIYGRFDRGPIFKYLKMLKMGFHITWQMPSKHLTSVDLLTFVIVKALNNERFFKKTIEVVDKNPHSLEEVALKWSELTGQKIKRVKLPLFLIQVLGLVNEGFRRSLAVSNFSTQELVSLYDEELPDFFESTIATEIDQTFRKHEK